MAPRDSRDIKESDLCESSKDDVCLFTKFYLLDSNGIVDEKDKNQMLDLIEGLESGKIRQIASIFRKKQEAELERKSTLSQLQKKGELLSDVANISPAQAIVIALISCGSVPEEAVILARSFLLDQKNRGSLPNVDAALSEFSRNEALSLLMKNETSALNQELIEFVQATLHSNHSKMNNNSNPREIVSK
jgi:hypothetical protein